jgi:hypothetical protein
MRTFALVFALAFAFSAIALPVGAQMRPHHVIHTVTPAMRIWVLRGAGPEHARILGTLDVAALDDDADTAIDHMQEQAFAMHADAIVHVRVEHLGSHAVRVHGVAVRFGA